MKVSKRIDVKEEEMKALLERVESSDLEEGDYKIIKAMAETIKFMSFALEEKNISIRRLRNILFGAKTEKTKNLLKGSDGKGTSRSSKEEVKQEAEKEKKPGGHGRNGAREYEGAERIEVTHPTLKSGDRCLVCPKGKVYEMKVPGVVVRVVGSCPLQATVYELQKLRCNLCGKVFTAELPEGCGSEKYNETAGSMIALLKYGSGLPFKRLEGLQESFDIPLAASTQWEVVERKADRIYPVYDELVRQAAPCKHYFKEADKMKTRTFVIILILVLALSIMILGCATTPNTQEEIDVVQEEREVVQPEIFFQSIQRSDVTEVKRLIEAGADVNAENGFYTALMWASYNGHPEVIQLLIEAGAEVNTLYDTVFGSTALILASTEGHPEVIQLLIEAEADVNARDYFGRTALMWASRRDRLEVAQLLIEAEADVNAQYLGYTALMYASREGYLEVSQLLIEVGAEVNIQDINGWTALILASGQGRIEVAKLLMEEGADVYSAQQN